MRHGFLPTIGDAMELFDEAWSQTSRMTVIKCWIKSQCLPDFHVQRCRNIITSMYRHTNFDSPLLPDPISHSEAMHIASNLNFVQSTNTATTQLNEILNELDVTNNTAAFLRCRQCAMGAIYWSLSIVLSATSHTRFLSFSKFVAGTDRFLFRGLGVPASFGNVLYCTRSQIK